MLIGEYKHNIDEKGRMAVPAKFRAQIKSGAVVTRGLDNCLTLYPRDAWKKLPINWASIEVLGIVHIADVQ